MADAMVTARMPQSKKEAGNKILQKLGYNASQAINELYDCLLETQTWPLPTRKVGNVDAKSLAEALAFIDGIARAPESEFVDMDHDTAMRNRLIAKGRAAEADFA